MLQGEWQVIKSIPIPEEHVLHLIRHSSWGMKTMLTGTHVKKQWKKKIKFGSDKTFLPSLFTSDPVYSYVCIYLNLKFMHVYLFNDYVDVLITLFLPIFTHTSLFQSVHTSVIVFLNFRVTPTINHFASVLISVIISIPLLWPCIRRS